MLPSATALRSGIHTLRQQTTRFCSQFDSFSLYSSVADWSAANVLFWLFRSHHVRSSHVVSHVLHVRAVSPPEHERSLDTAVSDKHAARVHPDELRARPPQGASNMAANGEPEPSPTQIVDALVNTESGLRRVTTVIEEVGTLW